MKLASKLDWSAISIGVAFAGNFSESTPTQTMIDAMFKFFDDAVVLGKISENYQITTILDKKVNLKGDALLRVIETWDRYLKP